MIYDVLGSLEGTNVNIKAYAGDSVLSIRKTFLQTMSDLMELALAKTSTQVGGTAWWLSRQRHIKLLTRSYPGKGTPSKELKIFLSFQYVPARGLLGSNVVFGNKSDK